MWDNVTPLNNG